MSGELTRGILAADSAAQVRRLLRDKGLFIIEVVPASRKRLALPKVSLPFGKRRVPQRELLTFTSQLAVMARSGIDLAGALQNLSTQVTHPRLRSALEQVHQDVSSGQPVSVALRNQGHVFSGAYVAIVAAGEASGRLPEVLARLSGMLANEVRRRSALRAQMAYPCVLAAVSGLVIASLLFFVLPKFAEVFADAEMPLPSITRVLLAVSKTLRHYWPAWVVLLVGGVFGALTLRASSIGRRWWDTFQLNGPLLGKVSQAVITGRVFRLLGMMVESGVPLLEALRLTRSSIGNVLYRQLFDQLEEAVLSGREMSPALAGCTFVPPAAPQMLATGEKTGNLATVTQIMGEYYEEEGETRMKALATMLEPLIIVVMGVIVAGVVLSVMLPMFDFTTFSQQPQ